MPCPNWRWLFAMVEFMRKEATRSEGMGESAEFSTNWCTSCCILRAGGTGTEKFQ